MTSYEPEVLGGDEDNGTMEQNVSELTDAVVGHKIVSAGKATVPGRWGDETFSMVLTLDNGERVILEDTGDCCAYTELKAFLLHPENIDHVITGVGTTGGFTTWHIYADMGDVLELAVSWSAGNPFYYGYGFSIRVQPVTE